jgi:hypothetical protein
MEALAPPTGKADTRPEVRRVEEALTEAGLALDQLELPVSIGRLAGLRADVVHKGMEQPELLHAGFYELEALTRLLLRHRLGIVQGACPLTPSESMPRTARHATGGSSSQRNRSTSLPLCSSIP